MPRRVILLLLLAMPLWAQDRSVGGPIELSHARYGTATGEPRLAGNASRFVLFWMAEHKLYAAPLDPTRPRLGRAVFGPLQSLDFDVVPIGDRFLVVAEIWNAAGPSSIAGQIVSLEGDPEGAPFMLRKNGSSPHIALGDGMIFLVYREGRNNDLKSVGLSLDGRRVVAPEVYLGGGAIYDTASVASSGKGFAVFVATAASARVVLYDALGQARAERSIASYAKDSAIAHNGRHYLAAWIERDRVRAVAISDDGAVGTPITLAICSVCQDPFSNVSVVWDGTSWIIAVNELVLRQNLEHDARLLRVDEAGTRVIATERIEGAWKSSVAVTDGAPVTVAWSRGEFEPIQTKTGLVTAQQPAMDRVVATASSSDSTLFVFVETTARHARIMSGIRARDGSWREEEIREIDAELQLVTGAAAGSDGREFLVAIRTPSDSWLFRLDQDGRPIGEPVRIDDFEPFGIAWTGHGYVLSGRRPDGTAALLIGDRFVRPAIEGRTTTSAIASDSDSAYGLWIAQGRLYGARIDRTHAPHDFGPAYATPVLMWTGKHYVAVWVGPERIQRAEITAAGEVLRVRSAPGSTRYSFNVSAARTGQTTAIGWTEAGFDRYVQNILFLDDNGGSWIQWSDRFGLLTSLPNGALALTYPGDFLGIAETDPATRVTIRVLSFVLPLLPEAPRAFWTAEGNRYTVEWTAMPQPVSGYRVEFRSRTEPWREIEAWFGPDQQSATITLPFRDLPYMFRVRAINDRGMGPYGMATRRRMRD